MEKELDTILPAQTCRSLFRDKAVYRAAVFSRGKHVCIEHDRHRRNFLGHASLDQGENTARKLVVELAGTLTFLASTLICAVDVLS